MIEYGGDRRDVGRAMWRGMLRRCPNCGKGRMFRAYLKVADHCPACGAALYHQRADDAPPYFTMIIVGHIVISGLLAMEVAWHPPIWLHMAIWMPATVLLSLILLPSVKGAIVGMQWANRMHGFAGPDEVTPKTPYQLP